MAAYAYIDNERKKIIYAANAVKEDRNIRFYCPNPECTAHLHVCAYDGSRKTYFRATKKDFPHIPKCPYGSCANEFEADKFNEDAFVFDEAMNNLYRATATQKIRKTPGYHNEGTVNKHPPRTLKQIYLMCKSKPVTDKYGDTEIGAMILDSRSEFRYPRGCFGNRIIESTVKNKVYDDDKKQVYLASLTKKVKYKFILQFADGVLYRTIRDEIYNNCNNIIIVAGRWEASGVYNSFVAEVVSKKQVLVVK